MNDIQKFLEKLSIKPKNLNLYIQAITHRSYSNEINETYSYERLEFLGDAIINKCVAEYLFNLNYDEGKMSKMRIQIVQSQTLIKAAKKIGLDQVLLLGKGLINKISPKIIEDVFEALIAAIYLDQGEAKVWNVLEKTLLDFLKNDDLALSIDYKSLLQEALQHYGSKLIRYKNVARKFDSKTSAKLFCVEVWCDNICYGSGFGRRLKDAEKAAAEDAYSKLILLPKQE